MEVGYFPEQPPPRAVRSKHKILVVIGHVFGAGVRRAAGEIGIMNLQELLRHGGGSGHHYMDKAQAQVHERAVFASQGGEGLVRFGAHVREVSDDGPWPWPWWERGGGLSYEIQQPRNEDRCHNGGNGNNNPWTHVFS